MSIIISLVVNVGGIVTTTRQIRAAIMEVNGIDLAAGRGIANDIGAANKGPVKTLPNIKAAVAILQG